MLMQTLDKAVIAQNDLFDDVLAELNLLRGLRCPLICNAHYAFQDAASLYICMDIFMGGDLRFYLLTKGPFTQEQVR
jgi:serine/threonine protein kinase